MTRDRDVEVLLVHRPQQRDWSLPKGKLIRRETALACALREVREETGLYCVAGDELPHTRSIDRKGRMKRVRYWAMQEVVGEFRPNDEVDQIRWLHVGYVSELLTYEHDHAVVAGLHVARVAVS